MNRPCRHILSVLLFWAGVPAILPADTLAPIEVTAMPDNLAARAASEDATTPVRVIDRREFANRIGSLADTVGDAAGVQVRQTGGLGGFSSVSLRGSTSQQVQVFIDGMLLNDPVSGSVDLSQFSLHDMARIRIYPSSPPAQFAHASIGGVVALETRDRRERDVTRLRLGGGSFDTRRAGLFHGHSGERLHYWLSLNHQASDNDFSYPNEAAWHNPNDGDTTRRRNADLRQSDASAKIGYALDGNRQIDALVQFSDQSRGVPTIQNWRSNEARRDNDSRRMQLHYQDAGWLAGRLHSSHRLLWSDSREDFVDEGGQVGSGRQAVRTQSERIGALNTVSAMLGGHTLTGSIDVSHYDYDQADRLDDDPPDERERLMTTTALGHEWFSLDDRWQTQAVARLFSVRDDAAATQGDDSLEQRDERRDYTAWQLGARRALGRHWQVSANLARQVRIPTLRERFGQQGLFVGNAGLEAEEALAVDGTVTTEHDWGHLEVTGYQRELEPAIVATYDARGVGRYVNTEGYLRGVEATARLDLTDTWALAGNATLLDSENRSPQIQDRDRQRLPGIYHRSAMLRSTWRLAPFRLRLSWHYDDELHYDAANRQPAEARRIANASVAWHRQWSGGQETEAELEVRNITDELYQDFNRFPGPGRAWFLTLNHAFF